MAGIYYDISLVTAGIALAMGLITLGIGVRRKMSRTELTFGLLGILLSLFIIIPPVGFIIAPITRNSELVLFKRIFIFGYYIVFPWFLYYFSGRPGRKAPFAISVFVFLSYFVLFADVKALPSPLWTYFAMVIFAINLVYGVASARWLRRTGDVRNTVWLASAMTFYAALFFLISANQIFFDVVGKDMFHIARFFPMHLHALAFILIMGLRLQGNVIRQFQLQREVDVQQNRWNALLHSSPVLVMELDLSGNIKYVNEFAVSRLKFSRSHLINSSWFDLISSGTEKEKFKSSFEQFVIRKSIFPVRKVIVHAINGELISVNWANFNGINERGELSGLILVGQDVTEHESALVEIDLLKAEIEKENLTPELYASGATDGKIIGAGKAISYAIQKAMQVGSTNATVLLEGETGVGKELFADLIHESSSRSHKPLIKVNCGALPSELIEDELFGHEKGAFTSAIQARTGRFELADGGTIFLDEIGELPLSMQPKLLRVLQCGEFERVGGQKTIHVDVRVIAATNRDMSREVKEGRFRSDLFYRLNIFPITVPSLRNRKEDLDELIQHFVTLKSTKYSKSFQQISKADLKRLHDYDWPGNVRELQNTIERSVIQSHEDTLKIFWPAGGDDGKTDESGSLEQIERKHIILVLNECAWKINGPHGAAERLDMNPNTLRSRMKKLDIQRVPGSVIPNDIS